MISPTPDAESRLQGKTPRPGLGTLLHDLISLVELQGRLLLKDIGELKSEAVAPVVMILGGIVLAFASAPVLLLTVGWCLMEFASMPLWAAMATSVFIGGVIPAALLTVFGWKSLARKSAVLQRSTGELKENTRWLKHRIKASF